MNLVDRAYRRLRYGAPIVIVSGLPRSGTSMAMKMLDAGGVPTLTDGIRAADESNPKGYFEFEPVKQLDKPSGDLAWLGSARGKAVKIISFLLTYLPETHDYRVIFMDRDIDEVLASQNKMLIARGEQPDGGDAQMRDAYLRHLEKVDRFLRSRACFKTMRLAYTDVIDDPSGQARRIDEFLGGGLDVSRMAAVADRELYRNRKG